MPDVIPWGEWKPDVSAYKGQHSPVITNAYPRGDGYGPVPAFANLSSAITTSACRGFAPYYHTDGTIRIFAGTASKLWLMDNSVFTFSDVSKAAASSLAFSGGSAIGNLTGGGNLAAAIDGNSNQNIASSASLASTTSGYVGYAFASAVVIRSAAVSGSNDQGYVSGSNPSTTLTLYGKNGTPSNATDGTSLGSVTFTDTGDEHTARTITSTSNTAYTNVWVTVSTASSSTLAIAEIAFTGTFSYNVATSGQWQHAQFGSRMLAVEANDSPQSFVVGTDTHFSDLAGSPPAAAYVTVVGEFVVLSGLTNDPFTIQWSSIGNPLEWIAGTNQGDTQTFSDGGVVRGVAGGEFGIVFQDNCIRQMVYQPGSSTVFSFTRLTEDFGLKAPYSVVRASGAVFFLSSIGFQKWDPIGGFKPIGKERIDRTFFADCDTGSVQLIIGANDPSGSRVLWAYKSVQGQTGLFDRIIVYDYVLDRWAGYVNILGEYINTGAVPSVTLDALDSVSSSLDALSVSLDSFAATFERKVALVDNNHKLGLLSGSNLEATLETPIQVHDRRVYVRGQRPVTDCSSVLGSLTTWQRPQDQASFGTEMTVNSIGLVPHRTDTRLAVYKNRFPAGATWTYSIGVEPDTVDSGLK